MAHQPGGSITLGGVPLHKLPSHERAAAGIGWVPQERNIFKSLTVDENLTAVARPARSGRMALQWTPLRVYEMLAISDSAVVLDHGTVVHAGTAQSLGKDPQLLERLLGVSR